MKKVYLKAGSIVVADSVLLIFDGTKYILPSNGLSAACFSVLDTAQNAYKEHVIKQEITEKDIKPYYEIP